jgi:hypothetical protein
LNKKQRIFTSKAMASDSKEKEKRPIMAGMEDTPDHVKIF